MASVLETRVPSLNKSKKLNLVSARQWTAGANCGGAAEWKSRLVEEILEQSLGKSNSALIVSGVRLLAAEFPADTKS